MDCDTEKAPARRPCGIYQLPRAEGWATIAQPRCRPRGPGESVVPSRYVLHEQIGRGGMGAVYRAWDRLGGGWVALKRVRLPAATQLGTSRPRAAGGDAARRSRAQPARNPPPPPDRPPPSPASPKRRRWWPRWANRLVERHHRPQLARSAGPGLGRNSRTLASLRHPHIISVFDYGFEEQQQPFYTMELLTDAQPLLAISRTRDLPDRVALLLQVLQALSYLHRRGVLHRDTSAKPKSASRKGDIAMHRRRTDHAYLPFTLTLLATTATAVVKGSPRCRPCP